MQLMKKTPLGTLVARYTGGEEYPGFLIDLCRKGEPSTAICMVEYDPSSRGIQVVVYGDCDSDKPTTIAKIQLPCITKTDGGCADEK